MAIESEWSRAVLEPHRDQAIAHAEETEHIVMHDQQPRPQRRYCCTECDWNDGSPKWQM